VPRPRKPPRLAQDAKTRQWNILFHDGSRDQRKRTGTRDRAAAEIALREFLIERGRPTGTGLREPHEVVVGDVLAAYAEEVAANRASSTMLLTYVGYLAEWFGDIQVASIDPAKVKGYGAARKAKKIGSADPAIRTRAPVPGDSTIRKELGVLIAALNHAMAQHRLTRVPPIELPPSAPRKDRWCTPEEVGSLLRAATTAEGTTPMKVAAGIKLRRHLRLFIMLALATGGRRGALTQILWNQVDLVNGMIDLNAPGRAQTAKRRPRVPIEAWMIEALIEARREAKTPFVIECRGEPVKSIARAFHALAVRAGLPDVTPHVLRHTVGTWAAQAGKPMGHIAWLLGHSSQTTTEIYAHQHPDFIKDTAGEVGRRMGWTTAAGSGGKPHPIGGK
jgi:integrase